MMKYYYKAINDVGKSRTGIITADSAQTAAALLKEAGWFVLCIEEYKNKGEKSVVFRNIVQTWGMKKMNYTTAASYCRQLSVLLKSGISLLTSLDIAGGQTKDKILRQITVSVIADLQNGCSLSESYAKQQRWLDKVFVYMIDAGECSGCLDEVLEKMADYYEQEDALRQNNISVLFYPVLVIVMAVLLVAASVIFVFPVLQSLLSMYDSQLPGLTSAIMNTAFLLRSSWPVMLLAVGGIVLIGCLSYKRSFAWRKKIDKLLLKLPLFGKLNNSILMVRFSGTLAILLNSGVNLLKSLTVVKKICGNAAVEECLEQTIISIKEGKGISGPLIESSLFPAMVTKMMKMGEETGRLEVMMEKTAAYYNREIDLLMKRLSAVLEPIMLLLAGGITGMVMLAVMLPLFSAVSSIR